jgi:hypothetical protein
MGFRSEVVAAEIGRWNCASTGTWGSTLGLAEQGSAETRSPELYSGNEAR